MARTFFEIGKAAETVAVSWAQTHTHMTHMCICIYIYYIYIYPESSIEAFVSRAKFGGLCGQAERLVCLELGSGRVSRCPRCERYRVCPALICDGLPMNWLSMPESEGAFSHGEACKPTSGAFMAKGVDCKQGMVKNGGATRERLLEDLSHASPTFMLGNLTPWQWPFLAVR